MTTKKYTNGAFILYRTSSACVPLLPSAIESIAQRYGIPDSIIPLYAGDREIAQRAIGAAKTKHSRAGWLVRPIKTDKDRLLYGIVHETKDVEAEELAHRFDATLRWTDGSTAGHLDGTHEIAVDANATYQTLRDKIGPADWTDALTSYLLQHCAAEAMRHDGRWFWCPPSAIPKVESLQAFLEAVGISLVLCEIAPEYTPVVQQAVSEGLAEQLEAFEAEVATFTGSEQPSTYKSRILQYQALRTKATMYRAALGVGVEKAQALLDSLEEQVTGMLSLRQQTVIHRDGTSGAKSVARASDPQLDALAALAAQGEEAVAAAIKDGVLDVSW